MKIKNKILLISVLCLFGASAYINKTSAQAVSHQTGVYYNELLNGRQKTHEYKTTVYVNVPTSGSNTVKLTLPSTGNASPKFYYRWYNYNTDGASNRLSLAGGTGSTGTSYSNGWVQYGGSYLYEMNYTVSPGFTSDIIACESSSNIDYTIVNSKVTVEPTLSYRCIFDIRPAKEIADQLVSVTAAGKYLEEKIVYMPRSLASTNEKSRLTLEYNPENYFGYNSSGALTAGTVGSSGTIKASGTGAITNLSGRFIFVDPQAASTEITVKMTFGAGATQKVYNIAKYTVHFVDDKPMPYKDLIGTTYEKRTLNHLDQNYVLLSKLDFDYNTDVANAENNMWPNPLPWDICSYGFSSKVLFERTPSQRGFDNRVSQWNEYGFYKTANVSLSGLSGYTWYNNSRKVYDRLHEASQGTNDGYFMYIDAALGPGIVAKLPIDPLCAGTKLVVSAAVASLTTSSSPSYPNLNFVFLGVDEYGNEVELNRYTSGDIPSATSDPTPWYQLFYSFTFDDNGEDYASYKLQVENNCTSTSGGDYAVDDIRVYRSKPSVQANQITLPCGDEIAEVKVRVEYDKLLTSLGETEITSGSGKLVTLKYKFLDENKNDMIPPYKYGNAPDYTFDFGQISISTNFDMMQALGTNDEPPIATGGTNIIAYTETEILDGTTYRYVVFRTPNNEALHINKTYHTVVANRNEIFDTGLCSLISDPFIIMPPYKITVDGVGWVDGDGMCYGNDITLGANLKDRITHEDIRCRFDWFIGSEDEFETSVSGALSIKEALELYRTQYDNPASTYTGLSVVAGSFTQQAYDILNTLITEHRLFLNQEEIVRIVRFGESLLAIPIAKTAQTTSITTSLHICENYIPIKAGEPHKNPTITWSPSSTPISLRMGVKQFNSLKTSSSKSLLVPINDFKNADLSKTRNLKKANDASVYLVNSDDPTLTGDSINMSVVLAKIQDLNITVDNLDNDYIIFNEWKTLDLKEGYTYKFEFHFNQILLNGDLATCDGTASLSIKIVPEYLTWTGTDGDNWNNDNNWARSTKADLYKDDGYEDYSSSLIPNGFVPMDFSNVTVPAHTPSSLWLYKLQGSPFLDMTNSNYTNTVDRENNAATKNIEYDLNVKSGSTTTYDCINFYGNTSNQIFFKSLAEMRNTNHLAYNRAHVEFELSSGRWYMLSSPLKNVVAGDMYLPSASGRQTTEAFQSITFIPGSYNRFNPAVYQRSWDKTESQVFKQDDTSFDAYIAASWSQVYNKVNESYGGGVGFSIKPVYGTNGTKVLFRLPKYDTKYSYYTNDNLYSGDETIIDINRSNNIGKFVFDNGATDVQVSIANQSTANNIFLVGNPFMATIDMAEFFDSNPGLLRKYWLITTNGISAVQVAADKTTTSSGADVLTRMVTPMQSFFVEKASAGNTTSVSFTPNIMTVPESGATIRSVQEGNNIADNEHMSIRATASGNNIVSSMLIRYNPHTSSLLVPEENSQAIIDSNLDDLPVLYSISNNQALIINTVNKLDTIPLGIYNNDGKTVKLAFNKTGKTDNVSLKVFDRQYNKEYNIKSSKDSISISGNSHGRYCLIFGGKDNIPQHNSSLQVFSKERGHVDVKLWGDDKISNIKIYSLAGTLVKEINLPLNVLSVPLPSNEVYIFRINTKNTTYNEKVFCK